MNAPSAIAVLPPSAVNPNAGVYIRHTRVTDFPAITALGMKLYPDAKPWRGRTLMTQLEEFARGQLVAADTRTDALVGCASSLIVAWDDYGTQHTWNEITANGTFKTHDSAGVTLYGADVMVDPDQQGKGIGKLIYEARRQLCRDLNLKRIRAMSRIRGYHRHQHDHTPRQYVDKVAAGEIGDPTLSFQLKQGFKVLGVAPGYLTNDPESLGHAAVIEWLNPDYREELG